MRKSMFVLCLLFLLFSIWSNVYAQDGLIDWNAGDFRSLGFRGRLNYATRESAAIVLNSPSTTPHVHEQLALIALVYRSAWETSLSMGSSNYPGSLTNTQATVTQNPEMYASLQNVVQQVSFQNGLVFDIWTTATLGNYPDDVTFTAAFEDAFGFTPETFRNSFKPEYANMQYSEILDSIRKFSLVGIAFKVGDAGVVFTPEFGNPEIIGTTLDGISVTAPDGIGYELIPVSTDTLVTTGIDNTDLNKSTGGVYLGGLKLNPIVAATTVAITLAVVALSIALRRTAS